MGVFIDIFFASNSQHIKIVVFRIDITRLLQEYLMIIIFASRKYATTLNCHQISHASRSTAACSVVFLCMLCNVLNINTCNKFFLLLLEDDRGQTCLLPASRGKKCKNHFNAKIRISSHLKVLRLVQIHWQNCLRILGEFLIVRYACH